MHIFWYLFYWFKRPKVRIVKCTLVPLVAKYKDEKEIVRCEPVLIVTELFNIAINDFGVKESARCKMMLVLTVLVTSRTRCIAHITLRFDTSR